MQKSTLTILIFGLITASTVWGRKVPTCGDVGGCCPNSTDTIYQLSQDQYDNAVDSGAVWSINSGCGCAPRVVKPSSNPGTKNKCALPIIQSTPSRVIQSTPYKGI